MKIAPGDTGRLAGEGRGESAWKDSSGDEVFVLCRLTRRETGGQKPTGPGEQGESNGLFREEGISRRRGEGEDRGGPTRITEGRLGEMEHRGTSGPQLRRGAGEEGMPARALAGEAQRAEVPCGVGAAGGGHSKAPVCGVKAEALEPSAADAVEDLKSTASEVQGVPG